MECVCAQEITGPPPVTGSDDFTVAQVSVGPDLIVASAQAGVDFDIQQDASFQVNSIQGVLTSSSRRVMEAPIL